MVDSKRVRQLGDIRVTALDDGSDDLPSAVMVNIDEAGAAALAQLSSGSLCSVSRFQFLSVSG
jgi:hypothetical protein